MTSRKTLVRCRCYGRIAEGPGIKSPWEDVWLRWKSVEIATTLKCKAELLYDLQTDRELHAEQPDNPFWASEIVQCESLLATLSRAPYAIGKPGQPTYIYTNANGLDRAEAERMLAFFLRERHGIDNLRFVWNKLPSGAGVMTAGFGDYEPESGSKSGGNSIQ